MKRIITSTFFIFAIPMLFIVIHLNAAESTKQNRSSMVNQKQKNRKTLQTKDAVKNTAQNTTKLLKKDQYSVEKDNKITIYTVKDYEGLSLTSNCFKNGKPNCEAYTAGLKKVDTHNTKPTTPYNNNLGSLHCSLIGGSGVIAKSQTNGESDFCLFKDGSMVSSWSAYYKIYPQKK